MWSVSRSSAKWLLPGVPKRQPMQELCFVGQHILLIAGFPATDWSLQPLAGLTCWSWRHSNHWSQWKQGDQLRTRKFFLITKAKFCSRDCVPFPSSCWIWTLLLMDADSYFTIASNYASNSGVRKTYFFPETHTQIVSWVHIKTRPWHLLLFLLFCLHLEEVCAGIGGVVLHFVKSPPEPSEVQALRTQLSASQSIHSQSSHSLAVWWLSMRGSSSPGLNPCLPPLFKQKDMYSAFI